MDGSSLKANCMTAADAATLIAEHKLSAEELAKACLARIAAREHEVNAWACIEPDRVLAEARALDAGELRGPLHGLPVGIKDIIDTADLPTQYGSPIYAGRRPAWDAACVSAIRAAGGIVMGKTVTAELATSFPGKTTNPHNPAHTPGGSSSGSAAAVADFMVPLALGTQTGGSVIRPASFCGVVGYKPSFGMINRHGVKPVSDSLDTVGLMARSVPDVALLAAAITGRAGLARPVAAGPPRIGIWRTYDWEEASPGTRTALAEAARRLGYGGATVREAVMHKLFAELGDAHREIQYFEMGQALGFELRHHGDGLSPGLRERVGDGLRISPELYDNKRAVAANCRKLIDEVFAEFDVLLAPSAKGAAPQGLHSTGSAIFNRGWTLLHLPCVTVPAVKEPGGLPIGVQVIGRFWHDAATLAAAAWIHKTLEQSA